jgi:hypothetical protein
MDLPPASPYFRRIAFVLSAVPLLLSGCKFFSTVTVPVTDTKPPLAPVSVFDFGISDYAAISTMLPLRYEVTDPERTYLAVSATVDSGGAKEVMMWGMWLKYCTATGVPHETLFVQVPDEPPSTAQVGDTVSNGRWSYQVVRFADAPAGLPCPGGGAPHHLSFKWFTTAVDFHGNETDNEGEILYYPHGH